MKNLFVAYTVHYNDAAILPASRVLTEETDIKNRLLSSGDDIDTLETELQLAENIDLPDMEVNYITITNFRRME